MRTWAWLAALAALWSGAAQAGNVGFEAVTIPVAGDKPLQAGIWYPTDAAEAPARLGPDRQLVATGAPVTGGRHPLVVISHGNGGWYGSHEDTARALAREGFIVAAVSHTGDTFDDHSRAVRVTERPGQLVRMTDYVLGEWASHAAVDRRRIGAFGFSSGGFTVLAAVGGEPDMSKLPPHCREHPTFYDCALFRMSGGVAGPVAPVVHDPRVRAAVVAAPALGFTFGKAGLANVRLPLQLWRAEADQVLPNPYYAEAVRLALPRAPDYHVEPGAGHYDFLSPCGEGLAKIAREICASNIDRAAFHARFNAEVVRFFEKTLR